MVWYDELYSCVRIPDVIKAFKELNGIGTLRQLEKKIIEMYKLPKGMLYDKDGNSRVKGGVKEPLETLISRGICKPVKYKNTIRYELRPDWRKVLFR